jgi:signal transduction histidine kinase
MVKILILEDNVDDVALIERQLKSAGFEFECNHAQSKEEFAEKLATFAPDVILADYAFPDFNGLDALTILQRSGSSAPFILISGAIGEEIAAEIVRKGAREFVLKSKLPRLSEVLRLTLDEKANQNARTEALTEIERLQSGPSPTLGDDRVRVLVLEDENDDQLLLENHLRKELPNFISLAVDNEKEFREQIDAFKPDIILADFSLPGFDGLSALKIRQKQCPDTPFLFVSSIIGEDVAIESLKLGVTDYVMKDKLSRLGFAVKRALAEHRERRLRQQSEAMLAKQQEQLKEQVGCLEQLNAELKETRDAAQQALILKSQFVANISHEIRTPMSGVLGMSELLMMSGLDEESRLIAEHICLSAKSLMSIVNDILDFSKLEAGRMQLEKREFSVSSIVEQVVHSIRHSAVQKNIEVAAHTDPGIPERLYGDDGRIKQTLLNLAHNAVKFTEEGSVNIGVKTDSRKHDLVNLRFTVEDTGIGIAADVQRKLFLPFVQADNSTTRRFGGTGLGLSICKSLVTLMSGDLTLESEEGKGSTFSFVIPVSIAAAG